MRKTPGQAAYEAYHGFKDAFLPPEGGPAPQWDSLSALKQAAWQEAGNEIIRLALAGEVRYFCEKQ